MNRTTNPTRRHPEQEELLARYDAGELTFAQLHALWGDGRDAVGGERLMATTSKNVTIPFPSDFGAIDFAFDPKAYTNGADAAKAFHKALRKFASEVDYDPDIEVWMKNPREAKAHGYGVEDWWVCWESGPYDWGITLSMVLYVEGLWYTEPYWGFDVIFMDLPKAVA